MKPSSDIAAEYRNFAIWVPTTPARRTRRAGGFAHSDFRKRQFQPRWRRDLNPRTVLAVSRFQGECIRPLCHATADKPKAWLEEPEI